MMALTLGPVGTTVADTDVCAAAASSYAALAFTLARLDFAPLQISCESSLSRAWFAPSLQSLLVMANNAVSRLQPWGGAHGRRDKNKV